MKAKISQKLITNRLKSLEELPEVSVELTGNTNGTIRITHANHHAPEFLFRWTADHFVGYFIDGNGNQSQAVVSLYTPLAAIQFVSAYVMLNEIRANQEANL
ncbi:MAG: hypothetical protein WCR46_23065 [Deltaproteobacteria bacterium]